MFANYSARYQFYPQDVEFDIDILRFVLAFRPKCQFDVDNSFEKNDNSSEIIVCVGRKNLTIVP